MEFDYRAAWEQLAKPEFDKLPEDWHVWAEKLQKMPDLRQEKRTLAIPLDEVPGFEQWANKEIDKDAYLFAYRLEVTNAIGHWAWGSYSTNGWHWKFENLGKQVLAKKGYAEERVKAEGKWENKTKQFSISKEMYEWHKAIRKLQVDEPLLKDHYLDLPTLSKDSSLDYQRERLQLVLEEATIQKVKVVQVTDVNHRLKDGIYPKRGGDRNGPFCIGIEHMGKSTGMYLDPRVAPCARTGNRYDDFTSDRVIVVSVPSREDGTVNSEYLQAAADALKSWIEALEIKGFLVTKPKEKDEENCEEKCENCEECDGECKKHEVPSEGAGNPVL
jgi:hypothetical protein